jgi:methionyl aminopeptidase
MPLRSNDPCWCGSGRKHKRCHGDVAALQRERVELGAVSPPRAVPPSIRRPDYVETGRISTPTGVQRHDAASLVRMRHAGAVAAEVLLRTAEAVAPGVTTDELDGVAHDAYIDLGAYPSTLHYRGFVKSICTSVNGVVCHGVPDSRPLEDGDIVNLDVTAYIDGMHGDTSATVYVGDVDEATRGLVESTRLATLLGIAAVRPHEPLQRVGETIEAFARSRGYGIVAEYGGHGIGQTFHGAPHVHHTRVRQDRFVLEPWMTFTVEPMFTTGGSRFEQLDDGWTERLLDGMPSAQFEHTVLVTDTGVEILTLTESGQSAVGDLSVLSSTSTTAAHAAPVASIRSK